MNIEGFENLSASLSARHQDARKSEEAYRVARATKFLEMAIPSNGEKKPSDEVIKARLDADPELIALRAKMETDAAELSVAQYFYRAAIATQNNSGLED